MCSDVQGERECPFPKPLGQEAPAAWLRLRGGREKSPQGAGCSLLGTFPGASRRLQAGWARSWVRGWGRAGQAPPSWGTLPGISFHCQRPHLITPRPGRASWSRAQSSVFAPDTDTAEALGLPLVTVRCGFAGDGQARERSGEPHRGRGLCHSKQP